jgi:hypothetical protein
MRSVSRLTTLPLIAGLLIWAGACAAAAAGAAGAVGAVYYNERGAESMVNAPVKKTGDAARTAFKEFKITETKTRSEQEAGKTRQVIEGTMADREVTVTIAAEENGSKVEVVARKSPVTWDKDFAKAILERVVSLAG